VFRLTKGYVRIEVFKAPYLCDDHFHNGWTNVYSSATITKDEDSIKIEISAGQTNGGCGKNVNFSTDDYPKAVIRCLEFSGNFWRFSLKKSDGTYKIYEFDSTGAKLIALPSGLTITEILLIVYGTENDYIKIDYVAIVKDHITDHKLVNLEVNDCLLEKGVSNAVFTVIDEDNQSEKLTFNSRVLIWICDEQSDLGKPRFKVFGGVINTKTLIKKAEDSKKCRVECLGLGYQLQTPPKFIRKSYNNVNGREIIKDVISESGVDLSSYKVDPDNEIATNFTETYDDKLPYKIINEICKESKKSDGSQGFDAWVHPSGVLYVFPRNKYYTSMLQVVPLTILEIERIIDVYRVKNKIKVKGAKTKIFPSNPDEWTEDDTSGWSSDGSVSAIYLDKKVGDYCIRSTKDGTSIYMIKELPSSVDCLFQSDFKCLNVWIKLLPALGKPEKLEIRLKNDDNNFFYQVLWYPEDNEWKHYSWKLGPEAEGWIEYGSPSWKNITKVEFRFYNDQSTTLDFRIDELYFSEGTYSAEVEDSTSQNNYGIRTKEIIQDDSLNSDSACQLKAESVLSYLKEPIETINCTIKGIHFEKLRPGWRAYVYCPDVGIETATLYRIVSVSHRIDNNNKWTIQLTFAYEPIYIDKIFRKIYENV